MLPRKLERKQKNVIIWLSIVCRDKKKDFQHFKKAKLANMVCIEVVELKILLNYV
jgi:hypothetical protein